MTLPLQFINTGDRKEPRRFAFIGPERSGKTTIAASFPRPIFIFPYNEGGHVVLPPGIPMIEVGSHMIKDAQTGVEIKHPRPVREHMLQALDQLLAWQAAGQFQWETVVVEQLSHYAELVSLELTDGGKTEMERADWGIYRAHLYQIRDRLWKLNCHIVITAHDKVRTVKDQVVGHTANIAGEAGKGLFTSCDAIGYCELGLDETHQVKFKRYGAFYGGTRIKGMLTEYVNFNFPEHIAPHL